MDPSSSVVIKVKYGDVLRRFNAQVVDEELNLNMIGLREKISSVFSFAPDNELMLTYVDEDNDVVNLVDDDDIHDVVKQGLNPLRITVEVNTGKNAAQYTCSGGLGSSKPLKSPRVQKPIQNLQAGVSETFRSLPEPLSETLVKLFTDLASKASSTAPVIRELVDCFSKVGMSYLGQLSESQPGGQFSMQGSVSGMTSATENKDLGLSLGEPDAASGTLPVVNSDSSSNKNDRLEGVKPGAAMENEVKIPTVTRQRRDGSTFDFSAVAAALESQNMKAALPCYEPWVSTESQSANTSVCPRSSEKEKFQKIVEMSPLLHVGEIAESCSMTSNLPPVTGKVTTAEVACNPNEPKLRPIQGNVGGSVHKTGVNIDVTGRSVLDDGLGESKGSKMGHGAMNECPFSGIPVGSVSTVQPYPAQFFSRRSIIQNDGSQNIIHRGIICDGCDGNPITGPRFKSKVKVNYDLCSSCFEKMGNDTDYIRMDFPVVYRTQLSFTGSRDAQAWGSGPILPQVYHGCKVKPVAIKLDSCFVEDVNIIDGTILAPLTPFTKIWRMRNNGTVGWLQGTQLVWVGGDKLSNDLAVELKVPVGGVWMDHELDIMVDFISPELPGRYVSYWRMATPSGEKFGQRVWVLIQVNASKSTAPENIRNLNLNLPPSNCLDNPDIVNSEPEPMVKGRHPEPDNSKKMVEFALPVTEQDLKFPINDTLLVDHGASSSVPSSASSSDPWSTPIIDLFDADMSLLLPCVVPPMPYPLPPHPKSKTSVAEKNQMGEKVLLEVEKKCLRDLEEMGFNEVNLNREVLRMNKYNLEQSVDDLCSNVAEWDSILNVLEDMGFYNRAKNEMLLKKNNGSIKRVVMELITGKPA